MVQSVPASYSTKNLLPQRTPVYVLEIDDDRSPPTDPTLFSTHPVYDMVGSPAVRTAVSTSVCMMLPRGIEAQVEPHRGRSSISSVTCPLLDIDNEITALITGVASPVLGTIGGKSATLKAGFIDIPYSDYITVAQGIIEGYRLTSDLTIYELTLRDSVALQNRKVFDVATSKLSGGIDSNDTTVPIMDGSAFQESGYIRIDDEIIAYGGRVSNGVAPLHAERIGVGFGNGEFLTVMADLAPPTFRATKSSDGQVWRDLVHPTVGTVGGWKNPIYLAAYSRWLICSGITPTATDHIAYSDDDGVTWTGVTLPTDGQRVDDLIYSPSLDRLLAVGNSVTGAYIASSEDGGITWTLRISEAVRASWTAGVWDATLALFIIVSNTNHLVAPPFDKEIATSPDGTTTWTYYNAPVVSALNDVTSDGAGHIVAVGQALGFDQVITSSNGTTFASHAAASANTWTSIVKANSWIAVASSDVLFNDHQAMVSDDNGATWTAKPTPAVDNDWDGLAYDSTNQVLVSVGSDYPGSGIMFSLDDGETWTIAGSFATSLTRGMFTTVAASHSSGATVTETIHIGPEHPMDIVVSVCENTDKSGASIDSDFVDEAGFATLKTAIGSSYQMEFFIYAAANLKNWIEDEIYGVLGLYPRTTGDGKISAKLMSPAGSPVATLSHDEIVQILLWDGNFTTSLFNSITINYDSNFLTGELQATATIPNDLSISNYGVKPLIINSNGLLTKLPDTKALIESVAENLLARYANTAPLVQVRVFLSKHLIEPGDIVSVTSALLPNPSTGTRGVTAATMEVISRAIVFDQGYVDLTLLWVSWGS